MKKSLFVLASIWSLCLLNGCTSGGGTPPPPPPAATHFSVTSATTPTAGTAFNFTVTALGDSGQIATSYAGTVHFASTDTQAVLPAASMLTNGTGTFSATLRTAGPQTLTVTDANSLSGSSNSIPVSAGTATHFSVTGPAAATTALAFNFTVTAFDAYNNIASSYSGMVHFSSSDGQAVLPPNSALTNGTGTFSATLKTIANGTIAATDTTAATLTGSSNVISVFSNAVTHFAIATPPNATTRASLSVTVTALDGANDVSAGYSGTVHFTSGDANAHLPGDSTLTSGTGTFSATFETVGTQTITATDAVTTSLTQTSSSIAVSASAALAITSGAPQSGTAGVNYGTITTQNFRCVRDVHNIFNCTPCASVPACASLPACRGRFGPSPCRESRQVFSAFTLTAMGGVPPDSWSASSLPPGLSVNSQNGQITGTPTLAGTYNIAVTVTDSGTPQVPTTANYPFVINNPPAPVINTTPAPSTGAINQPYSFTFIASGGLAPLGPWSESGTLPPGLVFNKANGLLSGTPTAIGSFPSITVMVQDAAGQNSAPQSFTIQIFAHGFTPAGSLATERLIHTATLLGNGKVLIAGGQKEGGTALATAELYDPTTSGFASTGSMGTARTCHTATLLNTGKVLVTGGDSGAGSFASAELFDPATGTFVPTGSMVAARSCHTATLLTNGNVLITGGLDSGTILATAEIYDPTLGSFSLTGNLGTARLNHTATRLNDGKVLIIGGNSPMGALTSAELFDPAAGSFSLTGPMATGRIDHTATLLNSGIVLVTGGFGAAGTFATAELYDPIAKSFSPTGLMEKERAAHTATLLKDGTVLVAGGGNSTGSANTSAELFDPATGSFTESGGLGTAREYHSATLLNDGSVLVVGGRTDNGAGALKTSELYQ
jgi:hypothetical protein